MISSSNKYYSASFLRLVFARRHNKRRLKTEAPTVSSESRLLIYRGHKKNEDSGSRTCHRIPSKQPTTPAHPPNPVQKQITHLLLTTTATHFQKVPSPLRVIMAAMFIIVALRPKIQRQSSRCHLSITSLQEKNKQGE